MTKYVELAVEDLRTRVRFPPTPPLLVVALPSNTKQPLISYRSQGFFVNCRQPLETVVQKLSGGTLGELIIKIAVQKLKVPPNAN